MSVSGDFESKSDLPCFQLAAKPREGNSIAETEFETSEKSTRDVTM